LRRRRRKGSELLKGTVEVERKGTVIKRRANLECYETTRMATVNSKLNAGRWGAGSAAVRQLVMEK
jgi:hypothetical protein